MRQAPTHVARQAINYRPGLRATASKAEPKLDSLASLLFVLLGKLGCQLSGSTALVHDAVANTFVLHANRQICQGRINGMQLM